jgi:molybdopterin molybdotransferase
MTQPIATAPVRPGLMGLDDALSQLLAHALPLEGLETVPTLDADGRVLAQDVVSALQVPPQDNSSMDGYAVRCADVRQAGAALRVTQRIPAGQIGEALQRGEAARIFTGASIPPGADAVVMQEDTQVVSDTDAVGGAQILVQVVPHAGQWIRRSGEDVSRGDIVLQKGDRLVPASLGLAASIGLSQLQVCRKPRVALFSTGDELVMPGDVAPEDMKPGAIYNSNRYFLRALLQRLGCEVTDLGIVPDRLDLAVAALQIAAEQHDLILTSGGVSVGEEDHVKPAVQGLGRLDLWQIGMKPGKPFAYGQVRREGQKGSAHFMGLPGNPVSSLVTFLLLVRPFILQIQGVPATAPAHVLLPAHFDVPKADRRREFLRVRRNAQGGLDLFPNQSSGVLTSAVWGDGLIDNPAGTSIQKGDWVTYISFADLLL